MNIVSEVWWGELGSDIQYRPHAVRLWVVWRPHMGDRYVPASGSSLGNALFQLVKV